MSTKKIKIVVFLLSFTALLLLIQYIDFSKELDYTNTNLNSNDFLNVQVHFKKNANLNKKKIRLYFKGSLNSNSSYSEKNSIASFSNDQLVNFKFPKGKSPKLLRINFDKSIKDTILIKKVIINHNGREIDLNLKKFLAHPSIQILKKKSDFAIVNLVPKAEINYDPYIYLETPIYTHKITNIELILVFVILFIFSFLISNLIVYLLKFKFSKENLNSILLLLLLTSLLFREHWISKVSILIGGYTLVLLINKTIKLKETQFFGFLLFFMFAITSLLWSVNIEISTPKLVGYLPFALIPLWLSSFNSKIRYDIIFRYAGIIFMLVSFTTLLFAFFRFNTTLQKTEFYYHSLSSPLSTNAIYMSILYLMIFLFNLYFLIIKKKNAQVIDYLILTVLFFYILLLSSKLISVLLFITSIIIGLSSFKLHFKNRKLVLLSILLTSSLIMLAILSNSNTSKRFDKILNTNKVKEVYSKNEFGDTYLWNGLSLRLFQLRAFYDIEMDKNFNSVLGVGLNNGQTLLNEKYQSYKLYTGKKWEKNGGYLNYNFHNQYAQTLIELGIIGFFLLIYIFYTLLINAKYSKNFLLFTIVFVFILVMFTESILVRQKGIMFFVLFPVIATKIGQYFEQKRLL